MGKFFDATFETIKKTLENLTFAGVISLFFEGLTVAKSLLTSLFFCLTVLVRVLILKREERRGGGQ